MARILLGQVVAERTYQLRSATGVRSVTVRIGHPVPDPAPGGDWVCPVELRGAPRGQLSGDTQPIYGVDALQAMVLAVGYAQQQLAQLQHRSRGKLSWLGSSDLGLPDIIGLVGVRRLFRAPRKSRLVERRSPGN